jgi:class 3 adenylate cyclase/DNA-binding winged helix-turn-helix (wHTH) protein
MPPAAYRFDGFTLDLGRGVLLGADGAELFLRPKSFALLLFLVESAGRLLSRDAIMSAIWPDVIVSDDSLSQCVHDIRRALGSDAQRLLRTVQRRGYVFAATVSRVQSAGLPVFGSDASPDSGNAAPEDHQRPQTPPAKAPEPDVEPSSSSRRDVEGDVPEEFPAGSERTTPVGPASAPVTERRQLTVLQCDLGGANELSDRLDPEDLGNIIRQYQERCAAAVARFDGYIQSCSMGGLVALFGYPQAWEDAAERAVHAALSIVETTGDLLPGPDRVLRVRVGIATGLVVNDATPQGAHQQIAIGRPLNLAGRMLAAAAPGAVILADGTRRLLGGLFALEEVAIDQLQALGPPLRAWRVTGEGVAESRFAALRGTKLMPLVGREQELTLLLDRWEQAREGEGQAVLLMGDPGIGKSRLVQALRDRLTATPHIYVGCHCSPNRLDSPLQPVIAHLERAANFAPGEHPSQQLAKLGILLAGRTQDASELVPLIASLLSIPGEDRYRPRNVSPQLQRERTLIALVDQLARLSARRPVLLVCEDVHWADATSLELLQLMIDRLQSLPVLALVTARLGFAPPWPTHSHVTGLMLNRLSRRRCGQLIAEMTDGKPLPRWIVDQIVTSADGVPLFVEELTKQLLEAAVLREEHDHYELVSPLPPASIPATLQDSLMARLDHLGPAKQTAQIAAVIGREFPCDLLSAIVSQEAELAEALHKLVLAELIFRRGTTSRVTYAFKHALVRDAAYASLLMGRRRELHGRIAQELEEHFTHVVDGEPDVLAHHWAEAGATEKAAVYCWGFGVRTTRETSWLPPVRWPPGCSNSPSKAATR